MSSGTKIVSVDVIASIGEPAATRPSSGSSTAFTVDLRRHELQRRGCGSSRA